MLWNFKKILFRIIGYYRRMFKKTELFLNNLKCLTAFNRKFLVVILRLPAFFKSLKFSILFSNNKSSHVSSLCFLHNFVLNIW